MAPNSMCCIGGLRSSRLATATPGWLLGSVSHLFDLHPSIYKVVRWYNMATITDSISIASLNRGPITTLFQQPTSCLATLTYHKKSSVLYWGHLAASYIDFACYPKPTVREDNLVDSASWDYYWYSPAICPQSWHIATTFLQSMPGNDDSSKIIPLGNGTTAALCCPTGYRYISSLGRGCISDMTQDQVIEYILPTNNGQGFEHPVSKSTIGAYTTAYGDGVPIWWQSSDSRVLAAASTMTPTVTDSLTATLNSSQTPTSSAESSNTPARGLPAGAKIGIGIAVPFFVIAVATLTFLVFRIRKQSRATVHNLSDISDIPLYGQDKAHIQDDPQELYAQPAELYSQSEVHDSRHELPGSG